MEKETVEKFEHPCCRCGFCCLATPCPIALERVAGAKKGERCPALSFGVDGDAHCDAYETYKKIRPDLLNILQKTFGIGVGCCCKGRAVCAGIATFDFQSLDPETKRSLAAIIGGRK